MLVLLGENGREHALLRRLVRALGGDDGVTEHRTHQRQGDAKIDEGRAPRPNNMLQNACHGGVAQLGQLGAGHNAHGKNGDQKIDGQDTDEGDDGCAANVLAQLGAARDDNCALDAQENPHRNADHSDNLVEQVGTAGLAPEVVHENSGIEMHGQDKRNDGDEQRDDLCDSGEDVDACGFLDAAAHQEPANPHDHRSADHGFKIVALAEDREKESQAREHQGCVGNVRHQGADPIAVGRKEAHVLAEAGTCVAINTAHQLRLIARQGEKAHHQGKNTDAANNPTDQHATGVRPGSSHVSSHSENATSDNRGNDRSDQMRQRQAVGIVDRSRAFQRSHWFSRFRYRNKLAQHLGQQQNKKTQYS